MVWDQGLIRVDWLMNLHPRLLCHMDCKRIVIHRDPELLGLSMRFKGLSRLVLSMCWFINRMLGPVPASRAIATRVLRPASFKATVKMMKRLRWLCRLRRSLIGTRFERNSGKQSCFLGVQLFGCLEFGKWDVEGCLWWIWGGTSSLIMEVSRFNSVLKKLND